MAADPFLSAFAEKFVDCLYNAGSRQLGYLLHYDYNIRKLSRQDQDLKNKKERLQGKINDAQTKGEIIFEDVQQWIADVDRMTIEVGKFFDDENKANKKCLKGWCINFRSCYRFSKEALRKIEEISLLLAKVGDFEAVSHPDPTPRTLSLAKGSSDAYESRRSLKKQVMEALNDKNVSVIGICARGRAHTVVSVLVSSFLLSIVDDDTEKFVKMNDILRDYAIYKSMNNHMFMAQAGIELQEWPSKDMFEDFKGLSLMSNDLHNAPDGLECPKLQALLLQNNPEMTVPESFFQGTKDLKVLDLSYVDFMSLPISISLLTNIRTLCLNNCKFVNPSVYRIGKLTKLEILSLSSSNVREIPVGFSQLTSLRLFDLTNCKLLRRIPQNVISCLGKLEELYMKNSFMEWNFGSNARVVELQASHNDISLDFSTLPTQFRFFDLSDRTKLGELPQGIVSGLKKLELLYMAIGSKRLDFEQGGDSSSNASKKLDFEQGDSSSNARVTELQALSKLTSLHIHIPGIRALPSDMPFQKLTNFVIGIGKSTAYNSCPSSRTLSLSDSMTPQVDWFKNLMKKTENLYLCRIKGLKVVSPDFDDVGFNKLKSLTLTECEEITYLLNTSKQIPDDKVFHNIEQLSLFSNPKLVEICKGELPDKSWSKLKAIDVNACHSMPSIVTSHFLQRLQSLERIQAVNCEKVVYAFDFKELVIAKEETYKLLPMLQTLELTMLTKMEQVWKGDSQFMSLCNLKRLKLDYCLELKKLFSPALQQTLLSLEHLEVICCYKLEEIFGKKETAVSQEAQATASPSLGKLSSSSRNRSRSSFVVHSSFPSHESGS
ncbi:hypothetical protein QYF36_017076 [Acer negundo]|nr:hypothetical protein QYF36_017076 [Acer negundo]